MFVCVFVGSGGKSVGESGAGNKLRFFSQSVSSDKTLKLQGWFKFSLLAVVCRCVLYYAKSAKVCPKCVR